MKFNSRCCLLAKYWRINSFHFPPLRTNNPALHVTLHRRMLLLYTIFLMFPIYFPSGKSIAFDKLQKLNLHKNKIMNAVKLVSFQGENKLINDLVYSKPEIKKNNQVLVKLRQLLSIRLIYKCFREKMKHEL